MICERYDIVVVPFPFHEVPVRKRRPVVVFSGKEFNRQNGWSVFMMVTTAKEMRWQSDIPIKDLGAAGLEVPCVARFRLQTMPNDIVIRRIGQLGKADRSALDRQLARVLE